MFENIKYTIAIIASAGAGHILFVAAYLWLHVKNHLPNKLLSLLLFCYSLRIIKSVLLIVFPNNYGSIILIALGVIGMSAIGPLLFFYVQSLIFKNFTLTGRHYMHFILTFLLLPTSFFLITV